MAVGHILLLLPELSLCCMILYGVLSQETYDRVIETVFSMGLGLFGLSFVMGIYYLAKQWRRPKTSARHGCGVSLWLIFSSLILILAIDPDWSNFWINPGQVLSVLFYSFIFLWCGVLGSFLIALSSQLVREVRFLFGSLTLLLFVILGFFSMMLKVEPSLWLLGVLCFTIAAPLVKYLLNHGKKEWYWWQSLPLSGVFYPFVLMNLRRI